MTATIMPSPPPLADPGLATALLEAAPAPLALVEADGRVAWANAAARALAGPLPEGDDAVAWLGGDDPAPLATLLRAGAGRVELRPRGSERWLQVEARPLGAGGRIVVALADLTPLKAAQAEVDHGARVLAAATEAGGLGVWERDLRTGRGYWDARTYRLRGVDGGPGGAPDFEAAMQQVVEPDRSAFERTLRTSFERAGTYSHRFRVRGADGALRPLRAHWVVQDGPEGRPERAVGLVSDDTHAWTLERSYDRVFWQLALAVDLAGIAIWRHDFATDRLHYSAEGFRALQIEPRPEGLPLSEVRELIHPDDVPQVLASAQRALETGLPTDMEARYRRADGQWRTVMARRVLQRDADGRPAGFIGVALDVTDRHDESRRALEIGRRFELATRAAGIGWWSQDDGRERPHWSAQLRAIHGLARGEPAPTLGEWLDRFVHPDERAALRQRLRGWIEAGRDTIEADLRIVTAGGEERHLIVHSRLDPPSAQPLLFGVVIDVTERRRAELALREAAERAALAARGAGLGTWELDLKSGVSRWDEAMWRLRGLPPRPQALDDDERTALVHPDDRELVQRLAAVAAREDTPLEYEFRVVRPDGAVRWIASRSSVVKDAEGRPALRIGVNWDVTDSRTAEAVRQEREIARRESQAKSEFLARISHELRTPLNGVLGFAQLLLAEDGGADAQALARRRRVEQIRAAGEQLLSLIDDVLDLSGLETGALQLSLQPVALAAQLGPALAQVEPERRDRGVAIDAASQDATALADPSRLRQVLAKLLGHAVRACRRGGRLVVDAHADGGSVVVAITDAGRRLDAEQADRLFQAFGPRADGAEHEPGSGIGLAVVRAVVERMGGSVRAVGEGGGGTRIELRLPAAAPGAAAAPAAPLRGTLLYIEDNPVNALIIEELIARRRDLRLHVAVDGTAGVRLARELRPDLVLLDMQLPDFDGLEVLRRLREDPLTTAIPVVALSANAMPDDIQRALRAGMRDYWTKPLDFGAFMASIDAMFGPPPAA